MADNFFNIAYLNFLQCIVLPDDSNVYILGPWIHNECQCYSCSFLLSYKYKFDDDQDICDITGKDWKCNYCSMTCGSAKKLLDHLLEWHIFSDFRRCYFCDSTFNQQCSWTRHMNEKHFKENYSVIQFHRSIFKSAKWRFPSTLAMVRNNLIA